MHHLYVETAQELVAGASKERGGRKVGGSPTACLLQTATLSDELVTHCKTGCVLLQRESPLSSI
jgi:hypothetical protein